MREMVSKRADHHLIKLLSQWLENKMQKGVSFDEELLSYLFKPRVANLHGHISWGYHDRELPISVGYRYPFLVLNADVG